MGTTAGSGTIPDDYVNGVRSEKTNTLPNIVAEDTSLRDETTKHFRCEDGSYILASYGVPVHYQDDNGEWKDIDNSLTLQEAPAVYSINADAPSSNGNFINGDSGLAVQLPQTLSENTQMSLHHQGKPTKEIISEYKITKSSLYMWEKQFNNSGKFTVIDNLSDSEKELRELRKINKRLLMENDILKQAALIMGRKPE